MSISFLLALWIGLILFGILTLLGVLFLGFWIVRKLPWLALLIMAVILAIIPVDPTDIIDFGTPVLELIVAAYSTYKLIKG